MSLQTVTPLESKIPRVAQQPHSDFRDHRSDPSLESPPAGDRDFRSFPTEIWLSVVMFLAGDQDRPAIRNLSLTNRYLRSVAQPALFETVSMGILTVCEEEGQGVQYCHDVAYRHRFLEYLSFVVSPLIAPSVRNVWIGLLSISRDDCPDSPLTDATHLMIELLSVLPCLPNLQHIRLANCLITSPCLRQLFSVNQIAKCSVAFCVFDVPEPPDPQVPPFHVRHLSLHNNTNLASSRHEIEWWLRAVSSSVETLFISDPALANAFVIHLASNPPIVYSIYSLTLVGFSAKPSRLVQAMKNLPCLQNLSLHNFSAPHHSDTTERSDGLNSIIPSLKAVSGPWVYITPFLKHDGIREIGLERLTSSGTIECLETIREFHPDLTSLTLDLPTPTDSEIFAFSLTQFPKLEKCIIDAGSLPGEVLDEVINILKSADLASTLRKIRIAYALPGSGGWDDEELVRRVREQCPNIRSFYILGSDKCLIWDH